MRTAEGDAWQVHGALRAGATSLRGIRLMASGLDHPQYNNADVTAADADIDGARAWYAAFGVPWGMRVPVELPWTHGRFIFEKRLMGLERPAPRRRPRTSASPTTSTPSSRSTRRRSRCSARAWLAPQFGAPGYETALAYLDGRPVATGYSILSDGQAGPALYVAGVAVLPEARGRGIGAALTSWLIARGFERGATLAHLHPDDDAAARLYARLGFVEVPGFNVFVNQ